ncbi:MAG: hypothetical protein DCC55_02520 [Chloroflexi bacterium]|nr:MAG: hypothetical protein DCC55_02520 [Chloroflexota bacterium]
MATQPLQYTGESYREQWTQEWSRPQPYRRQEWDGGQQRWFSGATGSTEQLARALGWFSIALGLAQVAAPRTVAQWIGVNDSPDNQSVIRAVGLREIVSGIGILSQSRPSGWLKARVGGDVMDLALLGAALNADDTQQERVTMAMATVAGVAALDVYCAQQLSSQAMDGQQLGWQQRERGPRAIAPSVPAESGIRVEKSITINRPADEIYQFWRNFENLPRFMSHLESVEVLDEQRSHWRAKAPAGMTVGWDAEIIDDTPGERISWRSLEGADVPNAGSVQFKPATGGRGTVVHVQIEYKPPGGAIGAAIAKLFGQEPEQQVQADLRAFKQVMETGDVVRSEATVHGSHLAQRPAQPPKPEELERVQS